MKKILLPSVLAVLINYSATAQFNWKTLSKKVQSTVSSNTSLSNDDIIAGLKEALTVGSKNSTALASKIDGYYKNPVIKIPFPKEAQEMESTLRNVGMGSQVDAFVLTINRAAEDAAKNAAPIFIDAVKKMSITDGLNILRGKDDAATVYLKNSTSAQLTAQFKPVIQSSVQKVNVTKYWNPLASKYNMLPFVNKVNPNLEDYITQKAIEGLFYLVAQEELKIRKDPSARVSDILKKVFAQ